MHHSSHFGFVNLSTKASNTRRAASVVLDGLRGDRLQGLKHRLFIVNVDVRDVRRRKNVFSYVCPT